MKVIVFFSCLLWIHLAQSASHTSIPVQDHPRVLKWIRVFQKNKQNYFNNWIKRSEKKLPKIKSILKKQGLPEDLAYLPLIESGLNPKAHSHANAVGYWQFIEPTAKHFNLKINWWIDERQDLIKSTWAAAHYLKTLYGLFKDWYLALSAYNMGETRLRGLIERHKTQNFWDLSLQKGFPKETKDYVPKYLAAALILKNPGYYGFQRPLFQTKSHYTYHYVPGGTNLKHIAHQLQIPQKTLKELNPELKLHLIPSEVSAHRIRVPKDFKKRVSLYFSKNL